jgi:cyclic pyranopterin phosphate synthase
MPEEGVPFLPRDEILSFDEITRLARVARSLGVSSLRLTGGEPLMRRGLVELVRQLATVGFDDIALTTNGTALAAYAPALARAGLHRVNVSCDSLQPRRFARIRRRGELGIVLAAMGAAESAGLVPLKVNVVVIAGLNDDEVVDFAAFARDHGRVVRFIEYMPLGAEGDWRRGQVVESAEVLARINDRWPLEAVEAPGTDPAPAVRYRFRDTGGEIGVVASVTRPFCGTCNRLRLTADGAIRNCLLSDDEVPVREMLRNEGSDEDLALALRRSVWGKLPGHGINEPGFLQPARSMSMIGG